MDPQRFGFVGAGQMAHALARALVQGGLVHGECVAAHDPDSAAIERFLSGVPGAKSVGTNQELIQGSDVVILAVKPQNFSVVAGKLDGAAHSKRLFVSVLAGVRLAVLCDRLATGRVIRVMPNTPTLVGFGAAAYAAGPAATSRDRELVERLFRTVGLVFEVEEGLLDAVTGLSGSGPAYVYTVIEALSDGGVRVGLPRPMATALAAQTVLGAARMVLATSEHPAVLRDGVTSPGGTTMAGLQVLERRGLRSALMDAVVAATERSAELGQLP